MFLTFWFTAQVATEDVLPFFEKKPAQTDIFYGKRVLVVEDYESLRQAMCRTLKGLGFEVDSAANGVLALDKLEESTFDLVLIDLYMPVMDSQSCTLKIRQNPNFVRLPIIGLTAARFAEDREELIASGIDDYLLKPFKIRDLVATMFAALNKPDEHIEER